MLKLFFKVLNFNQTSPQLKYIFYNAKVYAK